MRRALLLLLIAGCSPSPSPTPDPVAAKEAFQAHMKEHLDAGRSIVFAIAAGDLPKAHQHASWLVEHPAASGVTEPWMPRVDAMRSAAAALRQSTTVAEAAAGVVVLAKACADCHVQAGVRSAINVPERPSSAEGVIPHMARHRWAIERLWESLTMPSEPNWKAGLTMLAEASLEPGETPAKPLNEAAVQQEGDLHALAATGLLQTDLAARGETVVAMLVACEGCHAATRGGPGADGGLSPTPSASPAAAPQ